MYVVPILLPLLKVVSFLLNFQIASEKQVLDRLFNHVKRSVVVLIRTKKGNTVDFGTGFVVYLDRNKVLVCVDKSLIKNDESIVVRFYDNTQQTARVFMWKTLSRHAVLEVHNVPRLYPRAVSFSELEVTRQNLFTVAAVHKKGDLGLMTGTLGCVHFIINFPLVPLYSFVC